MSEQVQRALETLVQSLEIVGAVVLVLGFAAATLQLLKQLGVSRPTEALERYRRSLGRVILIGLEILVAATIVRTLTVDPSPAGMGLLAILIGIRTLLGWSMELEVSGRWPWQTGAEGATDDGQTGAP